MSEEQLKKVMDLFGADFKPEVIEDEEPKNFDKPLKGGYKARIVALNRYQGESDKCRDGFYDMYSLSLQIVENIEGDDGINRYLSKTYSNTESEFDGKVIPASEGKRKLMNDLYTGNVKYDVIKEADYFVVRAKYALI